LSTSGCLRPTQGHRNSPDPFGLATALRSAIRTVRGQAISKAPTESGWVHSLERILVPGLPKECRCEKQAAFVGIVRAPPARNIISVLAFAPPVQPARDNRRRYAGRTDSQGGAVFPGPANDPMPPVGCWGKKFKQSKEDCQWSTEINWLH